MRLWNKEFTIWVIRICVCIASHGHCGKQVTWTFTQTTITHCQPGCHCDQQVTWTFTSDSANRVILAHCQLGWFGKQVRYMDVHTEDDVHIASLGDFSKQVNGGTFTHRRRRTHWSPGSLWHKSHGTMYTLPARVIVANKSHGRYTHTHTLPAGVIVTWTFTPHNGNPPQACSRQWATARVRPQ